VTWFSKRLAALPSYPMAEIPAVKRRLLAQGVDVIDLGAGDADFAPPELAVETLARASRDPDRGPPAIPR
jgi:LL-diaminopimelate aminotransferase